MLSTPTGSKKEEAREALAENMEAVGTSTAVKETIDTIFSHLEEEIGSDKPPQILEENEDQVSVTESSKAETRSVKSVRRISSKQKLEMFKNLPTARRDEYRTYTAQPNLGSKHKRSGGKLLNVKENKREET